MDGSGPVPSAPAAANAGALDTLPKLLLRNAASHADRPAMRHKDFGIWQTWTWAQLRDEVCAFAIGLRKLGLERGDVVAIIGDNRPRLYATFAAVQSLGGIPVPVYQDAVADEMAYVLEHAEARFAVVEDQEQVDKVISIADRLPKLERIIYDEERGLAAYDPARLHSFEHVQDLGREEMRANSGAEGWWLDEIAKGKGADVSVMLYTSGTTGRPKGVMLTHDNIIVSAQNGNKFDGFRPDDMLLAYLPMAWVGDHIFSYGQAYAAAMCVCCPESPETVVEDRREIGPTYFFAPPRVFENLLTQVMVRMEDAGRLKKRMFHYFLGVARRCGEQILDGKPVGAQGPAALSAGRPPRLCAAQEPHGLLAHARGLHRRRGHRAGAVPLLPLARRQPEAALRADRGQRLHHPAARRRGLSRHRRQARRRTCRSRSPTAARCCSRAPACSSSITRTTRPRSETKTPDGWVHTGDAGFFDQRGHLKIIDRAKDVGRLINGALFAPKYLENRIKFYPEVREAVAFGQGRDYVTMFINIDPISVGNWAERNNVSYASYQELAAHSAGLEMIAKRVDELNRALAEEPQMAASQIRRFLILHKELDADDGELTRTQKVRRSLHRRPLRAR